MAVRKPDLALTPVSAGLRTRMAGPTVSAVYLESEIPLAQLKQ
jgi:hypothetical protein